MSPPPNYLAVLVAGLVIFLLGGLWYSPALFAKKWIALQGRTPEQMKADSAAANMPMMYLQAFITGLITAYVMSLFMIHTGHTGLVGGAHLGFWTWIGFAAPTSYAMSLFSMKPKELWLIDTGYNLVAFVLAGAVLGAWT